ncbi:MAG: Ig-like domain-containing protein, partial [Bryobacteraceae bacterium]
MAASRSNSNLLTLRPVLKALAFCSLAVPSFSAVYDIGSGQPYPNIGSFDWSALQPGDTVQIHYGTYHEFVGVTGQGTAAQLIRVVGIPDPITGALPVIDGDGATVGANLDSGTPERGLVAITPYSNAPAGYKPMYIEIANLRIQNAHYNNRSTYPNGATGAFLDGSAGVYIFAAEHIVVTNCTITANRNGFLVLSGDASGGVESDESRDITLQYSSVYGNGVSGEDAGHNIYSEASGIIYQYNYLGSPAAGSLGDNLKDRSAGTVIRYNWIESGAHMLDLVDPRDSANVTVREPSFRDTYVYGNVFRNTSTSAMVHYGGDRGVPANDRNGTIYIYNNTVVVHADQSALYQTELLELTDSGLSTQTGAQHGDVRNNIFYVESAAAGANRPIFDFGCDGPNAVYANWIGPSYGWQAGYDLPACANVTGLSNLYVDSTDDPGFTNAGGLDYRLLSGSHASNRSVPLADAVTSNPMGRNYSVTRQYLAPHSGQARRTNEMVPDFGAFESGSANSCSSALDPALAAPLFAGGDAAMEAITDAGCPTSTSSSSDSRTAIAVVGKGSATEDAPGADKLESGAPESTRAASGTPACSGMSLGNGASLNGFVPFPSTNAWNINIASANVDPNSAVIVAAAGFAGNHLHPDFGAESYYGIPYVVVDSSITPSVPINVLDYADESDVVVAPYPISAPIEGAPADCSSWPDTYNGDAHVLVLDRAKCILYETFNSNRCNGSWNSSSETIWDMTHYESRPYGWTSADAAGLPIFPGLVRYDEVASGAINHAIRFTLPATKNDANGGYFVSPATHAAGVYWGVSNIMGMRIRLKSSFNISGFSRTNQIILTAMQQYGMILADNGSYFYFQGASDPRWNDSDLANLESVGSANFDVIQMTPEFPGEDSATAPTGALPVIGSFRASATSVSSGSPVTFTYSVSGDSYDYIDMIGPVTAGSGSVTINPAATQTYTLNSTNAYGRTTSTPITVTVPGSVVAAPTFTPSAGTYSSEETAPAVTISTMTSPSATIYYTTNGSTPTTQSAVFSISNPIAVSASETLKAIAAVPGYSAPSAVGSATYIVVEAPQNQAIAFASEPNLPLGTAPFALLASSMIYPTPVISSVSTPKSTNLTVSFTSTTPSICTVSGTTVTLVAVGTCTIRATQAGNSTYAAAPPVNQSFEVIPASVSPPPAISSLSPASTGSGGAAFTLTVNGANFVSGAVAEWNGAALSTSFVSAAELTASVPAALIGSAGTASVTVVNPGGATSAAATFTINATPSVHIDAPAPGATVSGTVSVSGWAIDNASTVGTAISSVQVLVDGVAVGAGTYGINRPDVCAVYPGRPGCPNVGFTYSLNTTTLTLGSHTITVTATDSASPPDTGSASVTVTVTAPVVIPSVHIDMPASGTIISGTATVAGWAIDNASTVGTAISGVQVLVDGVAVGAATYGVSRPDVCSVYPGRPGCPNVGFTYSLNTAALTLGSHVITVTATDSASPPDTGSASVTVTATAPVVIPSVHIDAPAPGATVSGTISVSGWAIDNASTVGTAIGGVQVLVDGTLVGAATYGVSRPDVCSVYPGRPGCPNVGFTYSLNTAALTLGSHTIT